MVIARSADSDRHRPEIPKSKGPLRGRAIRVGCARGVSNPDTWSASGSLVGWGSAALAMPFGVR
jgi:hypothetical protein